VLILGAQRNDGAVVLSTTASVSEVQGDFKNMYY